MQETDTELISTKQASEILGESIRQTIRYKEAGLLTPVHKLPGIRGAYIFNRFEVEMLKAERAGISERRAS